MVPRRAKRAQKSAPKAKTDDKPALKKRQPEQIHHDEDSEEESEEDEEDEGPEDAEVVDDAVEEEFHTEDSDQDDEEDETKPKQTAPPYLPASLLNSTATTTIPDVHLRDIPWQQLSRKQKKNLKSRSHQKKIRDAAKGSGVLEAGKAAQKKRGILAKVKTGRVEKSKVETSGKQKLLEQRKKMVGQKNGAAVANPAKKKGKAKSKAKSKSNG
jgi:hypothetical protein